MAFAKGLHQSALLEHQLALLIGDIAAYILLEFCLLMVVDAHQVVSRLCCQERNQGGLTTGCGTL